MTANASRSQHLFVVRLWQEPSQAAPPGQWRGSAEHVPSGEHIYFAALADLSGFISRQIEPASAGESAEPDGP